MHDTELDLSLGKRCIDCVWKALQAINTGYQDILHAAILELCEYIEPELGTLIL